MSARPPTAPLAARVISTPMGSMRLAASDEGLVVAQFLDGALRTNTRLASHPHLDLAQEEFEAYFAGKLRVFSVPLALEGTPFYSRVWQALTRIPFGTTRSYADVARAIGTPAAVRAVGLANARNTIAVIIPCHRVIGSNGSLTGYGGGLDRKRALLELESSAARTSLFAGV